MSGPVTPSAYFSGITSPGLVYGVDFQLVTFPDAILPICLAETLGE